jgi:glyoxylase-like metal-dependent hydrolase (beta-lactamase superfamily II)
VHKNLNANNYEVRIFELNPELIPYAHHVKDKEQYEVGDGTMINVIKTPGHRNDHFSYGLTGLSNGKKILFPGDLILGSDSVSQGML